MSDLLVTFALPNPAGKDRTPANRATNERLNAEWVQFGNAAPRATSIQGVGIYHYMYNDLCQQTGEDFLTNFRGTLDLGQSIRVHSGHGAEYWEGSLLHVFLGRMNFVWNNRCGDTAVLRNAAGSLIDWAAYEPRPGEGMLLERLPGTHRLVPAQAVRRVS